MMRDNKIILRRERDLYIKDQLDELAERGILARIEFNLTGKEYLSSDENFERGDYL